MKQVAAFVCLSAWLLLLGTGTARTDIPPAPTPPVPSSPDVILPDNPQPAPPPPPVPSPGTPTKLGPGVLYPVRANVACAVLCSPAGVLRVTAETGPLKVFSRFVDAPDKMQCRVFSEKYVYLVEVGSGGLGELIVIPSGASADKIIRRMIDAGQGPQPPPPGPTPPVPPSDPFGQAVAAAYAAETDTAKAQQVELLAALYRVGSTATVNDLALKTYADLLGKMHAAAAALVPDTALPKVRAAVGEYLKGELGTSASAAIDRAKAGAAFAKIATALEGLK